MLKNKQTNEYPPDEIFLTEQGAKKIYPMSSAWYARQRWSGGGPPYVKNAHGAVHYPKSKLLAWLAAREVSSTSDSRG